MVFNNNEHILDSIKKMLGVAEDDTDFDYNILFFINTTFPTLYQEGALYDNFGTDEYGIWGDIPCDPYALPLIQRYILMKTKLNFDPPDSSYAREAITRTISEDEWRLSIMHDTRLLGENRNV